MTGGTDVFDPTPDNCTIDGYPAHVSALWDQLDWSRKEWRDTATIMVAVLGEDDAPNDPHWRVPHKDPAWGTFHRVRFRALPLCDRCGGTGEGVAVDEDCWKCDGAGMIENPDEK